MLHEHLFHPFITFEEPADGGADAGDNNDSGGQDGLTLEQAKAELSKVRNEAAKYRTRSKEFDTLKSEHDKLKNGLKSIFGEEEVDPEALKQKTTSLESELKTERVKNTVTIQAISAGLDPDLTIAYLQNQGKLNDIDHTDTDSVSAMLEKAAESKPALKVQKPDKVGGGGGGNDASEGALNPIDAYRQKRGLIKNGK